MALFIYGDTRGYSAVQAAGQYSILGCQAVFSFKASPERFELSTHCLEGSCSIQLSYRDVW